MEPVRRGRAVQSPRRTITVSLDGAVDLVTQDLKRNPGTARETINFEPGLEDGFRRIDGYERFNGRAAPSDAAWQVVELTDASDRAVGETLTGAGGASGVITVIDGNQVAVTAFNGTNFVAAETTNGTGNVVSVNVPQGDLPNYEDNAIELAAQDHYRALINVVPGSG